MGAPFVRNSANVVRNSDGSGSAVAEAHSIAQNILAGGRSLLFSVAYMIPRQMGGRHIRTPVRSFSPSFAVKIRKTT